MCVVLVVVDVCGGVASDWKEEEQAGECGEAEVPPAHHNEEAIQLASLGGP